MYRLTHDALQELGLISRMLANIPVSVRMSCLK